MGDFKKRMDFFTGKSVEMEIMGEKEDVECPKCTFRTFHNG